MGRSHETVNVGAADTLHIQQPHWWALGRPLGLDRASFGLSAASVFEDAILRAGPHRVAAFMGEPIQSAGGVIVPPDTYWPEIQRICDAYGVLLISEEAVSGFGRSGAWFCSERMGVRPDLLTFAKGLTSGYVPLGGVLIGERVAKVLAASHRPFQPQPCGAHPVACAVGVATLQHMHTHALVARVHSEIGPYFAQACASLATHPLVAEVQSYGLMAALQFEHDPMRDEPALHAMQAATRCQQHCARLGLIVRSCGDRLMVAPPLVITQELIDEMADILHQALDQTAAWVH